MAKVLAMKIKMLNKGKRNKVNPHAYHAWLVVEQPRSRARLGQLNKFNKRTKKPSEFLVMARQLEDAAHDRR